jgi:hypothetical protein
LFRDEVTHALHRTTTLEGDIDHVIEDIAVGNLNISKKGISAYTFWSTKCINMKQGM